MLTYLSYSVYPLKILRFKGALFLPFVLIFPYLLLNLQTPFELLLIQVFVMLFVINCTSAMPIFFRHFPVFRRFTYAGLIYALSRTAMSIVISFGLVYLVKYFGHWGISMVMFPVALGYMLGVLHFENLEEKVGNYPQERPVGTR